MKRPASAPDASSTPSTTTQRAGRRILRPALNLFGYQLGWFACVLGAAHGLPWPGAAAGLLIVVMHLAAVPDRRHEGRLLLLAGLIGLVAESAVQAGGLVVYASGWNRVPWLAPGWILVLWIQFATLLRHSLRWLHRPVLASVLGAVGGPLAFRAGEALGAVRFGEPRWAGFAALGLLWAVALPILVSVAERPAVRSA